MQYREESELKGTIELSFSEIVEIVALRLAESGIFVCQGVLRKRACWTTVIAGRDLLQLQVSDGGRIQNRYYNAEELSEMLDARLATLKYKRSSPPIRYEFGNDDLTASVPIELPDSGWC